MPASRQTPAQRYAQLLERERVEFLGVGVTIELLGDGASGYSSLIVITSAFMVDRISNLVIGEEYLRARIAEQTGVTHTVVTKLIAVKYLGVITKASVIEDFIDARRVLILRLGAEGSNAS